MTSDENYTLGQVHVVFLGLAYDVATAGESYGLDPAGKN